MNLLTYVETSGGTAKRGCPVLARIAEAATPCSPDTLYMIARGHKPAGPKMANRIEQATKGQVTRFDLRPDVFGAAAAKPKRRRAA